MSSSVQTILNAVNDELGLPRPSGYVGGTDISVRQQVALFHLVCDYLVQEHEWNALVGQGEFTTQPGVATYATAAYFSAMVDETMWNTATRIKVYGPRDQQEWARVEGSGVSVGPYYSYQMRDNVIYLQPTPTVAQRITYYYVSDAYIVHVAGPIPQVKRRALSDADKTLWGDDRMIIAGIKAQWLRAKRLSYDQEQAEFERRLRSEIAADRGNMTRSLDPDRNVGAGPTGFVVPIGNWSP